MTLSDLHPISMTFTIPDKGNQTYIWKLDPSILTDEINVQEIHKCLSDYFTENDTPDTSKMTQWEVHKCVVRGKMISITASIKKAKKAKLADLFTKLKKLEALHKRNLAQKTHSELVEICTLIQDALNQNVKKNYILSQKLFYEYGNKSGHLLAQALRKKKSNNTIHQIHSPTGTSLVNNNAIATEFEKYYSSLYDLHKSEPPITPPTVRSKELKLFLEQFSPDKIPTDIADSLESPITVSEWEQAIKQLKPGKSRISSYFPKS